MEKVLDFIGKFIAIAFDLAIVILIIGGPEYELPKNADIFFRYFDADHWLRTTLGIIVFYLIAIRHNMLDREEIIDKLEHLNERIQDIAKSSNKNKD